MTEPTVGEPTSPLAILTADDVHKIIESKAISTGRFVWALVGFLVTSCVAVGTLTWTFSSNASDIRHEIAELKKETTDLATSDGKQEDFLDQIRQTALAQTLFNINVKLDSIQSSINDAAKDRARFDERLKAVEANTRKR